MDDKLFLVCGASILQPWLLSRDQVSKCSCVVVVSGLVAITQFLKLIIAFILFCGSQFEVRVQRKGEGEVHQRGRSALQPIVDCESFLVSFASASHLFLAALNM